MSWIGFFWRAASGGVLLAALAAAPAVAMPGQKSGMSSAERFDQMDANKDGIVVVEEFKAVFPNMNEKAFAVIDINGDKAIDRAEWLEFSAGHAKGAMPQGMRKGAPMNNIPGDPLIPPPDSNDLPLMQPPN